MALSKEDVLKIARLARLELTADEIKKYGDQLSSILEYVKTLEKLDVKDIEPMAHAVTVTTPFREDREIFSNLFEKNAPNAPSREGNLFKVPKVL